MRKRDETSLVQNEFLVLENKLRQLELQQEDGSANEEKVSKEIANINWTIIEVETTLALALCLAGIILCIASLCEPCPAVSPRRWAVIAAGLMLASCILLLQPVIHTSEAIDKTKSAVDKISEVLGQRFITVESPWAMALSGTGMVLAFICCILLLIAACKHRKHYSEFYQTYQNGYPTVMPTTAVVPTMFSNYSPRPMSDSWYQDQTRPLPKENYSPRPMSDSLYQDQTRPLPKENYSPRPMSDSWYQDQTRPLPKENYSPRPMSDSWYQDQTRPLPKENRDRYFSDRYGDNYDSRELPGFGPYCTPFPTWRGYIGRFYQEGKPGFHEKPPLYDKLAIPKQAQIMDK